MIRNVARNAALVAVVGLVASAVAVGCTSKHKDNKDDVGSIGLALKLAGSNAEITVVSYKISGNGIAPLTGMISVADPAATTSVLVSGIPAGLAYLVEMSATSTDGKTSCGGSATFDVQANVTGSVTVLMQCRAQNTTGSVVANGTFNQCPALTGYSASPLAIAVGGKIAIGSAATDFETATLTYAWTATAGTFDDATHASTNYNCSVPGAQTLTITVSDGDVKCNTTATIAVMCKALSCGNSTLEPALGEQCDPPSTANHCDANCQIIPVCGNSMKEAGEDCDPPNGVLCDANCHGIPIVCGNNIIQPTGGEQCDPPNGTTCDASCHTLVAPVCGDGVVNQASEECEPKNTATCDANCKKIDTCGPCETTASVQQNFEVCAPEAWGCSHLTGTPLAACNTLLNCIRTKGCYDKAGHSAQPCYCGTASDIACLGTGANGACKVEMEMAAGTTDSGVIAGAFSDPSSPVGLACNQVTCDSYACAAQCTF